MNRVCFTRRHSTALLCLVIAGALGLAGQAKPTNLFKEVVGRKGQIVWKNAPASAIPRDVCEILQACGAPPNKFIALPPATEGGRQVARGLFLSRSSDNKSDVIIMLRQTPVDAYFFALGLDGGVQKAAYWATRKQWVPMGVAISRRVSDRDKQVWLDYIAKLSSAAAPAADSKG